MGLTSIIGHAACVAFIGSVGRAMLARLELTEHLAFYGVYHQDPTNQLIHFIFVPTLLWSFLLLFARVPLLGLDLQLGGHRLTYASLIVLIYSAYYVKLSPDVGGLYMLVLLAMYRNVVGILARDRAAARKGARKKSDDGGAGSSGTGYPLKLALIAQAIGWYAQLHPGHGVFEKVKPALLDGFGQVRVRACVCRPTCDALRAARGVRARDGDVCPSPSCHAVLERRATLRLLRGRLGAGDAPRAPCADARRGGQAARRDVRRRRQLQLLQVGGSMKGCIHLSRDPWSGENKRRGKGTSSSGRDRAFELRLGLKKIKKESIPQIT